MKYSVLKLISILLIGSAISMTVVTSSYAQSPNHSVDSEETKVNCCDKMEMMRNEMKAMMKDHEGMKNDVSSLFKELQQTGKVTPEQIKKMQNIEQMMMQMEEKMEQMSAMGMDDLK